LFIFNSYINTNILEMRKFINNILTTTLEGLVTILFALVIIGVIVVFALIILGVFTVIFGEHDFWLLRLLAILLLCYVVGKLINI
jgi:hypothetical protein